MKKDIEEHMVDMIFACGPHPMLKAVRQYAIENNIPCQISLEERMGCGIGACLGCATKIISGGEPRYGHVCKEGPVFYATDVEI
jgi:dihydroorotate dehydrogenase electron transfer subunit